MPIYGEASNHRYAALSSFLDNTNSCRMKYIYIYSNVYPSAVSLENPDLSVHARAKHMKKYSAKVILNPGDALFIPEGWYVINILCSYTPCESSLFRAHLDR